MEALFLVCFISTFGIDSVISVAIRGSSPSGKTVIAVSSSSPDFENRFSLNHPAFGDRKQDRPNLSATARNFPDNIFDRSFSIVGPGQAFAGTGRGFVSANNFLPTFLTPFNFEVLGLNDFKFEDMYDPSHVANGEVRTVSAVNDNGRVYSEVKTVRVDDKERSHVLKSVVN